MKSDMENEDLINNYELLKKVNPVNPFTVPAGYFDSLGDRIMSSKNLDELKNNELSGGFSIPENYFDELANTIQSRIVIENICDKEHTGLTIPDGYFNGLEEQIKSRVLIAGALGETAGHFTVPQDYFNQLNKHILNKTANVSEVKRNAVVRKLFASTAFKYATAACFALFLGGGILLSELNSSGDEHKNSFLHKQLSGIPVDEIKNYLQLNLDPGETQQTVVAEGTPVDEDKLQNALRDQPDSVQ